MIDSEMEKVNFWLRTKCSHRRLFQLGNGYIGKRFTMIPAKFSEMEFAEKRFHRQVNRHCYL